MTSRWRRIVPHPIPLPIGARIDVALAAIVSYPVALPIGARIDVALAAIVSQLPIPAIILPRALGIRSEPVII